MNELMQYLKEEVDKKEPTLPVTISMLSSLIDKAMQARDAHEELIEQSYNPLGY